MVQPKKACGESVGLDATGAVDADILNKKYHELLDSLLNDQKSVAIQKHPELITAYKALEVYEVYFLAGGDWDEVGKMEFKKKMAKTLVSKLIKENDSSKL